eukprot:6489226-Prymnesium_polylepis.1
MSQLVMHTLSTKILFPVLIKMTYLSKALEDPNHADTFATAFNFADAYLRITYGGDSPKYKGLRQMLLARRVLLLLDGIDEGGTVKLQIEEHITGVLQPQGHVMVVTSRPTGLSDDLYGAFEKLELCPLTLEQQLQVVDERLADVKLLEHAPKLRAYIDEEVPRDSESGQRITGN